MYLFFDQRGNTFRQRPESAQVSRPIASGIGKRAAQIFQRVGIEVPYTGNARHYDYHTTNIIYPPGSDESVKQGAKALAELCGITNPGLIRENRAAESLTLIIGHDKETIFRRLASLRS